ncbi:acyl-CoA dehydrogenase family protein [Devosia sp.]|uniref:acyl-CoA dehydrogenase family protein n=1 Tax=Devosia sp. TaxID=1871048 RepID=UPI001AD1DF50|nr:acyl-CoA dehydrogenase family protein [Devosia sp.]MBN9332618.1 acyl-CoA/acyl-ACP dehydrogenase [Devosia sp.]
MQEKLGRLQYFIETATAINANVALKLDHPELGEVGANETGVAKIVVRENAVLVSDLAVQLAGGGGLAEGNSLARHHRDALCGRAHGPAEDIVLAGLARQFIDVAQ